jgi:hypothetical protein
MPRGDSRGPVGMGAMTGRAAGYCAGYDSPGYANINPGRGFGMGRGPCSRGFGAGGRGRRNMFYTTGLPGWQRFGGYAPPYPETYRMNDPEMEKQALKSEAEALQAKLDSLRKRLDEIETKTTAK